MTLEMQPTPDDKTEESTKEEMTYPLPLLGTVTLDAIREAYPTVEEAIQDKSHLMRGYVTVEVGLANNTFVLRTLRRREQNALQSPKLASAEDADVSEWLDSQDNLLLLTIDSVNGDKWRTPDLSPNNVDTWMTSEVVTTLKEFVANLDASLVEMLISKYREIELVKAIFLRENLKNL